MLVFLFAKCSCTVWLCDGASTADIQDTQGELSGRPWNEVESTLGTRHPLFWLQMQQQGPPIGGTVRNAASLIPQRLSYTILANTCSEHVHAWLCIDSHGRVGIDHNTTPAVYVMHRSNTRKSQSVIYVTRRRWWYVHLSPIFGVKEQKMSNRLHKSKWSPWTTVY